MEQVNYPSPQVKNEVDLFWQRSEGAVKVRSAVEILTLLIILLKALTVLEQRLPFIMPANSIQPHEANKHQCNIWKT